MFYYNSKSNSTKLSVQFLASSDRYCQDILTMAADLSQNLLYTVPWQADVWQSMLYLLWVTLYQMLRVASFMLELNQCYTYKKLSHSLELWNDFLSRKGVVLLSVIMNCWHLRVRPWEYATYEKMMSSQVIILCYRWELV